MVKAPPQSSMILYGLRRGKINMDQGLNDVKTYKLISELIEIFTESWIYSNMDPISSKT